MTSEFRELERPQAMRKKDVVLLATVTSFEGLSHPSKSELRQFAELFAPLYTGSSNEARRQAVAALSQSPNVPAAVAFFIGCQPIAIAAPFLAVSKCLSDEALVAIARTQGLDHVRAIVRREALSPTVIDALVGLRHDRVLLSDTQVADAPLAEESIEVAASPALPVAPIEPADERAAREEDLRNRIKLLAAHLDRAPSDRLGLRTLTPTQEALLVRFARNREAGFLARVLSDILMTSTWLAERVMLDLSGQQMAMLLKSLGMGAEDGSYMLTRLYGHLAEMDGDMPKVERLWNSLDEDECGRRVEAWRKADRYTHGAPVTEGGIETHEASERVLRTSATVRRNVAGSRNR
ncbi:DUF2336 domain-containing protein [Aliirhizobium terrae]|uniref:DUF2336 domain-containing protein n=1 Tax=Terrirhizobium terrae TaxID=2926709 RepID=UPI0025781B32|nr:DUF2336 domain-containing protein [Rhizobium sp. CC-CFT758]WJH39358.1 DUF2336 domain-containing protein [Rhizobium sp. CC-CFT758]